MNNQEKRSFFLLLLISIIISGVVGGLTGFMAADAVSKSEPFINRLEKLVSGKLPLTPLTSNGVEPIVGMVDRVSPAVVSVIVSKDLPKIDQRLGSDDFFRQFLGPNFDRFFGQTPSTDDLTPAPTEKQEVSSGSGFIVSKDGFVVTNRHVVADEAAEYTVVTSKGDRHTAKVMGRDPVNDLAILKIEGDNFPFLNLGDSNELKAGQSVIAIGNALGEFSNTVSTGVISGLSRSIDALSGFGQSERLIGLIQTDASINPGNSGGPLLNTDGEVIGINVAVAQGAQNIGFTIPINQAKPTIDSVRKNGRLIRAYLGVRYIIITPEIAKAQKLTKEYGALVVKGKLIGEVAVVDGSPADTAGLKENDIILEVNGKKIDENNPLATMISQSKPGDKLDLKIWRDGKEKNISVKLEEMKL